MFARPWQAIFGKRHFRTPAVRICMAPRNPTRTSHLICVCTICTKLEGPVTPCATRVRLPDRSRMFTRRWSTICCERNFYTPPVRICTAPRIRIRTSHLICVCTSCTKLEGPVAPCTTGVQLPDCSQMFTRPWQTNCSKRHYRTPAVRICTTP